MSDFTDALNEQLAHEFGASQQYIAIAVWYDNETLPLLAPHFYRQAVEERNHAILLAEDYLSRTQIGDAGSGPDMRPQAAGGKL